MVQRQQQLELQRLEAEREELQRLVTDAEKRTGASVIRRVGDERRRPVRKFSGTAPVDEVSSAPPFPCFSNRPM